MTWMESWGRVRVETPGLTAGRAEEDSDVAFTSQLKVDRVAETLGGHWSCELTGLGRGSCQLPFRGSGFRGNKGSRELPRGTRFPVWGMLPLTTEANPFVHTS